MSRPHPAKNQRWRHWKGDEIVIDCVALPLPPDQPRLNGTTVYHTETEELLRLYRGPNHEAWIEPCASTTRIDGPS